MKEPLEDTWHDILLKALRGWNQDPMGLALENHIEEKELLALVAGNLKEATLVALAPSLQLDPQALLAIAHEKYHPKTVGLPNNFKRFTTSYHGMQVHSYLLWSSENQTAVAFDTGADLAPLLHELSERHLKLSAVFLTHSHGDHVFKLKELVEVTGATAWMNEAELLPGTHALPGHHCWKLDNSITIESHSLPGHSAGGTAYVIQGCTTPLAVVGDTIFAGSVGGIKNNFATALTLMKRTLLSLPPTTILAPGHGPLTTVDNEAHHNPFFVKQ